MQLLSNTLGKKVLMAVTGLFMLLFVAVHLLGNTSVFAGPGGINVYAAKLHGLGPFVWVFRLFMGAMLAIHVIFGVLLTLDNRAANPGKYAVKKMLKATFASETMIWTGLLLLAFLGYHLAQFTLRVTPDIGEAARAVRPGDVFSMMVGSFRVTWISLVYIAAMVVLFLHLSHGIQSIFQTVGLSNDKALVQYERYGTLLSVLFLLGYCSIPVLILAGFGIFAK
jgi:succinate dehydrogenase / fumarate reductase cytochrome b subunit